ncbi:uncharacterized protein LOC131023539 [Salvia miltiorrhiza]|uniref:uncharacterized protein LOC131023539 n=1 Tax=Salvia miltiorrhiza TaxID=226208 RepID=UPI0025ABA1BF|nr:uncharacterized protein LOC131023539 [Salvia miltiorrhiza]
MSEPDGEGTGISRHVGGSQSTRILQQYMSLEPDFPQDSPNYATFLRLHMYPDGSYTSPRDARIDAEVHQVAAATGRQNRLDEVYLEVVHPDRSRIYGVGSAGQSQASRGSIRSTGTSAMSQQLYETRISTLEERLAAEQAQRQQMEERMAAEQAARQEMQDRMAQLEAFMRMYNAQLPPPHDADDDDDDDDDDDA